MTASYVGASVLVAGRRPERSALVSGFLAGVLVALPVPVLSLFFVLGFSAVQMFRKRQELARSPFLRKANFFAAR